MHYTAVSGFLPGLIFASLWLVFVVCLFGHIKFSTFFGDVKYCFFVLWPNSEPAHLSYHWSSLLQLTLLIPVIISWLLIPFMNCFFSLPSLSLYSNSLASTVMWPVHSSALSFLPLLAYSIELVINSNCAEVWTSLLIPQIALSLSCIFLLLVS